MHFVVCFYFVEKNLESSELIQEVKSKLIDKLKILNWKHVNKHEAIFESEIFCPFLFIFWAIQNNKKYIYHLSKSI